MIPSFTSDASSPRCSRSLNISRHVVAESLSPCWMFRKTLCFVDVTPITTSMGILLISICVVPSTTFLTLILKKTPSIKGLCAIPSSIFTLNYTTFARALTSLTHKKGNRGGVARKSLPHNLGNRNRRVLSAGSIGWEIEGNRSTLLDHRPLVYRMYLGDTTIAANGGNFVGPEGLEPPTR